MAFSYGGITRIRFEGFVSPALTRTQDPQRKSADYNPLPLWISSKRAQIWSSSRSAPGRCSTRTCSTCSTSCRARSSCRSSTARSRSPTCEIPLGRRRAHVGAQARGARAAGARACSKTDRVLEVGTGSGYLTALLAHRAAHVYSVEINPALAAFGRAQPRAPRRRQRHAGGRRRRARLGAPRALRRRSCSPARRRCCRARFSSSSTSAGACSPWSARRRR